MNKMSKNYILEYTKNPVRGLNDIREKKWITNSTLEKCNYRSRYFGLPTLIYYKPKDMFSVEFFHKKLIGVVKYTKYLISVSVGIYGDYSYSTEMYECVTHMSDGDTCTSYIEIDQKTKK